MIPVLRDIPCYLYVVHVEPSREVDSCACSVAQCQGGVARGRESQEMVGQLLQDRLCIGESFLVEGRRQVEHRQVKRPIRIQRLSQLIGTDCHREKAHHLRRVVRRHGRHHAIEEPIGSLAGGHRRQVHGGGPGGCR